MTVEALRSPPTNPNEMRAELNAFWAWGQRQLEMEKPAKVPPKILALRDEIRRLLPGGETVWKGPVSVLVQSSGKSLSYEIVSQNYGLIVRTDREVTHVYEKSPNGELVEQFTDSPNEFQRNARALACAYDIAVLMEGYVDHRIIVSPLATVPS